MPLKPLQQSCVSACASGNYSICVGAGSQAHGDGTIVVGDFLESAPGVDDQYVVGSLNIDLIVGSRPASYFYPVRKQILITLDYLLLYRGFTLDRYFEIYGVFNRIVERARELNGV